MASRMKHMKRSRRSYHDIAWQNSFRRTAFLRERDSVMKDSLLDRLKAFFRGAAREGERD